MRRRDLFGGMAGALALGRRAHAACACMLEPAQAVAAVPASPFQDVGSKVRITGMKAIGVSLTPQSDRPYVFVKLETNQGLVGWGEATLEGKAAATMACVNDFSEHIIGADPMQVEHLWQSMYVHSFYRAGPVMGSAISGIDQALWDLRGKILGMPVYKLLGGPFDARGVRGYYHASAGSREQLLKLRESAEAPGRDLLQDRHPRLLGNGSSGTSRSTARVRQLAMAREALGPEIDIAVDFHAKPSATVASILVKELEPLNLLFVEEPCPPENVKAMARISAARPRPSPPASAWWPPTAAAS